MAFYRVALVRCRQTAIEMTPTKMRWTYGGATPALILWPEQVDQTPPLLSPSKSAFTQGEIFSGEPIRSEEHTSELQSLMRISYAVFCLKKKKYKPKNKIND